MSEESCIFCQIISKIIPSNIVYEDELSLAFLDIFPVSKGHTIVIPKKHYQNIEEISDDTLAHLIIIVKQLSILIRDKLNVEGYNILQNNFPAAGQAINHCHFHIIPRTVDDDKFKMMIPRTQVSNEYLKKVLELLT
ncbi:MAG: HIT family protein [Candidatus Lokiarchaeota archaeon]|nr:HIT family protein [Candidatus Lokiarchaeota archaeon]